MVKGQEGRIREALQAHAGQPDLALVDIWEQAGLLVAMLNPIRRAKFGTSVVELLHEMRKPESTNAAADLWNRLTSLG